MFAIDEQNDLDLVDVGIASLRKNPPGGSGQYSLVILEPLSVEVIKNVLAEWDPMKEIRERLNVVLSRYSTEAQTKGVEFEMLAA